MSLIWGQLVATTGKTIRRPRTTIPLSRDRIEAHALELIEEQGIDLFSIRKLAERLGCQAMSIYNHFPSKAHIFDALMARVLGSIPIPDRSLTPAQRLREFAQSWRALARESPKFYLWLSICQWNSVAGTRFLSEMLACFYDAGFTPQRAAYGFRVLGYYVQGVATDESSGYANGPSSVDPIGAETLARDFPQVAEAHAFFTNEHFDNVFELGFGALLRKLELE